MTAVSWDSVGTPFGGQAGYWKQRAEAAQALAIIDQRRALADAARIRQLEGAIQEMCGNIRGLASQGEDYIWRPVKRALDIADQAIAPDRDSGSGPEGENSRSEVEGEAPQSGGDSRIARPSSPPESPSDTSGQ